MRYYYENHEKAKERKRAYYQQNREAITEKQRSYNKKNTVNLANAAQKLNETNLAKGITPKSMVTHEAGHMIDASNKTRRVKYGALDVSEYQTERFIKEAQKDYKTRHYTDEWNEFQAFKQLKETAGDYAFGLGASDPEIFAEAFRLYEAGKLPKEMGYAVKIFEDLQR